MKEECIVIRESKLSQLVKQVNKFLKKDFELQGGVCYDNNNYCQAMIKQTVTYFVDQRCFMKRCPLCDSKPIKVIYYGLPCNLCENEQCNCLFGFWDFITDYLPFNGVFYAYKGSYFKALINWIME